MALIKCPECGKDVSDKAKACPSCGCDARPECPTCKTPEYVTNASNLRGFWDHVTGKQQYFCNKCRFPFSR